MIFDLTLLAFVVGTAAYVIWVCWIDSIRTWSDPLWHFVADAERKFKKHRLNIWTPFMVCIAMQVCGIGLLLEEWYSTGSFRFDGLTQIFLLIPSILLIPIGLCCAMIYRHVNQRFHEVLETPHCFTCGYNLRGNPDATTCPECGAEIPRLGEEQQ